MIDVIELHDGGQRAEEIAARIAAFLEPAQKSLELALYDIHLVSENATPIRSALTDALARGVRVRLVYNFDFGKPISVPPPPATRPELIEALKVEARGVSGVPDLMHHKYVVRDGAAIITGSTNWTDDSWTREENLIAFIESRELASRYLDDFEQLWTTLSVAHSGKVDSAPISIGGHRVRPWFAPGRGDQLSHRIARRIAQSRRRIRIASPVLTSGPILGTLAELPVGNHVDVAAVVDATQVAEVIHQWRTQPHVSWKEDALRSLVGRVPFSGKVSTPWTPQSVHDFMHAKIVVADDAVFLGSFNLSRSGERNAENTLEIEDAELAEKLAAFIDEIRKRYAPLELPAKRSQ
jgi:phosphatidylserine/phosphatidylglycerophosphate/cardiolipin synthase-like enzyme